MNMSGELGHVKVVSFNGRGASVEELAERATNKIISVGENSHPAIVEQARVFREQIRSVIEYYMHEAIQADRATQINSMRDRS